MTQSLNCRKVVSLLALYIDDKLDFETREFVEKHLEVCPECKKKYLMLKDIINELKIAYKEISEDTKRQENKIQFNIKEHENFKNNISAYFDNELPLNQSLNIKKYMIKFPKARKELEELYMLHNIITTSFKHTKKEFNNDYAKIICYKLQGKQYNPQKELNFKIATYVASILLILTMLLYSSPIGKTVIDKSKDFFKKNIYVSLPKKNDIAKDTSSIDY